MFVNGSLTGQRYRDEILAPYAVPYAGAVGPDFILMVDNATAHRARIVNAFLDEQGIQRMYWPAQSPDLNPLEHVWDMLQRRIQARNPQLTTRIELTNALVEELGLIPLADIRTLEELSEQYSGSDQDKGRSHSLLRQFVPQITGYRKTFYPTHHLNSLNILDIVNKVIKI